ncbi:MAG: hypothetical protein K5694_06160 [Bacilli bacterium]|nr:hypothetical protein [Bacilli bacterium]
MKYTNTSRFLSTVFHALILLGFGALGVIFAFFITPYFFSNAGTPDTSIWLRSDMSKPFNLYAELGIIGLTLAVVSGYGLFQGIKSILNPSDDKPVVKSFAAFFADGYIAAVFFILQAAVYFNLTANGSNIAFVIIMAVIIAIIILIGTNIPMVRVFDGKDSTDLFVAISLGATAFFASLALVNFLPLIGSLRSGSYNGNVLINTQLTVAVIAGVVGAILSCFSLLIVHKKGAADKKGFALSNYLNAGALAVAGAYFIAIAVTEFVFYGAKGHLNTSDLTYGGNGYPIMLIVVGSLLVIAALVLGLFSGKEPTKKANRA